jgi:hypothetical protein
MTNPPDASAESLTLTVARRRRRWARVLGIVATSFAAWPTVLQIEPHALRADSLGVAGANDGGAGLGGGRARASMLRGPASVRTSRAPTPTFGALREAPPSELETLSSLRQSGAQGPFQQGVVRAADAPGFVGPTVNLPSGGELGGDAPPISPLTSPAATPSDTAPIIATPSPGGTPVTVPPIVVPPGAPTPPVTSPPVVTPPGPPGGIPPTTPPIVITPPDNPPVTDPITPIEPTGPNPPGGPGLPSPTPEPATWLEMLLGAGMVGAALRSRRAQRATALRAFSNA